MSDSESSNSPPSRAVIEAELRRIVRRIYVTGKLEELTVKRVRIAAEVRLGLKEGFYKQDEWKDKSKAIIETEAKEQDRLANSSPAQKKRQTNDDPGPSKRQKVDARPSKSEPKPTSDAPASSSALSKVAESPSESVNGVQKKAGDGPGDPSESELSELIDDDPQPERRTKESSKKSKKPKESAQRKKKEPLELDPDAAEIKRLQSWLIKCGVRKMWARELKPYETSKLKIKHLRDMLADVGMTGRFSVEKAAQIREARELQADLEAVQEGAKYWGKKESDEEEIVGARPKRRLARGLQELAAFGDSESD